MRTELEWWQEEVIYEIVVPSFQDSNGDGIGDLQGIVARLPYLRDLGVGAIWLTPIYPSPFYDLGYDVSDYTQVDARFGSLEDFDQLLEEVHRLSMHLILDFVPNHTSIAHPWFIESQSHKQSSKRDWFIWADASGKSPPNNWINRFGDPAWTWHAATSQFYLGSFSPNQPDLNWRNDEVRSALFNAIRFWLERGVDGLRIDALSHLIKDRRLRSNPIDASYTPDQDPSNKLTACYNQNQPELLDLIRLFREQFDAFDNRVFAAEVYQTAEQLTAYQNAGGQLLLSTSQFQAPFNATDQRKTCDTAEARTAPNAWPARSTGNHDIGRLADRVDASHIALAATLHFTARGTPCIYYGEELGLSKSYMPIGKLRDPSGVRDPRYGRDGHRVPMPWDDSNHLGFSTGMPWLPADSSLMPRRVELQRQDPLSIWNLYRHLIDLRKQHPLLVRGEYRPIDTPDPIFCFFRHEPIDVNENPLSYLSHHCLCVCLNFSAKSQHVELEQTIGKRVHVRKIFSTSDFLNGRNSPLEELNDSLTLSGHEGLIVEIREINRND